MMFLIESRDSRGICGMLAQEMCNAATAGAAEVRARFREITPKRIRRCSFHSVPEFVATIGNHIQASNKHLKPFIRTDTAAAIIEKIERFSAVVKAVHRLCRSRVVAPAPWASVGQGGGGLCITQDSARLSADPCAAALSRTMPRWTMNDRLGDLGHPMCLAHKPSRRRVPGLHTQPPTGRRAARS